MIAIATGCDSQKSTVRTEPTLGDTNHRPDTEVTGARIQLYDKERVTNLIDAKRLLRFEAKDSTVGYVVTVHIRDSAGTEISTLVGDSSLIRETSGHFSVFGNVVAVAENGTRLETDYLHWNPVVRKIQTDAFVKITRQGDVVTGWGLEATEKLTDLKILRQVSGSFRDTSLGGIR